MRILVTGANGLVGKKITRQLLSGGKHEVYATSLKKLQIPGAVTFTSNLLNADINFMVDETHP
ncbi:MAG TPA: sugar nucleotide-binding protein, partial [Tenuifilaceae bacterium]|nr:sugar nucleotide-binding protein [Tenuifilaceae bacterium]